MISACVTKDFGVLAADSALYDSTTKHVKFTTPKINLIKGKYLTTFVGDPSYFSNVDHTKFENDLASLSLYLQQYLLEMQPKVIENLKSLKISTEDQKGHLCLFILGTYNHKPTLVQLNSFYGFKPKYHFSDNGPKFVTIYYGDDEKKNKIFSESTQYMEKKARKWKDIFSPGIAAEILTRGIYKKSDLEMETYGKKYAGGAVVVASLTANGESYGLSNVRV